MASSTTSRRPPATWKPRQWLVAAASTVLLTVLVAVPTDLVDTPWFTREIPPTWWSWPGLLVSAALAGLLIATYVRSTDGGVTASRRGWAGGLLTFFAVGCPVCNKLVLLALGSAGALTWFEPVQPALQLLAVVLLAWALRQRLTTNANCPVPPTSEGRTRA